MLLLVIGLSVFCFSAAKDVNEVSGGIPLKAIGEIIVVCGDEKKVTHLIKGETAIAQAEAAVSKRDYQTAHDFFKEAIAEIDVALGAESQLACILMVRQADFEQEFGKFAFAEKLDRIALKGIAANDGSIIEFRVREHLLRALTAQGKPKYLDALALAKQNLAMVKQMSKTQSAKKQVELIASLNWLAHCYNLCGQPDQAIETDETTIHLLLSSAHTDADIEEILLNEAAIERDRKHFEQADVLYDRAIKANPSSSAPYFDRASDHAQQGKNDLAITEYKQIIERFPKELQGWHTLASAYEFTGDYTNALKYANIVVQMAPEDPTSYSLRASVYEKNGKFSEAISDADRTIEINATKHGDSFGGFYENRAQIFERQGKHKEALADLDQALKRNPKSVEWLAERAAAFDALGKKEDAKADRKAAADSQR